MVTRPKVDDSGAYKSPSSGRREFHLTIPKPLDLSNRSSAAENFQLWKTKFQDFCILTQLNNESKEYQMALFRQSVGDEALKAIQRFKFDPNEDPTDWRTIMNKLEDLCRGERNETYERYRFFTRSQQEGETFDEYLCTIENLADTCNFSDLRDSLIRDRIVTGLINTSITKQLLAIKNLSLQKCIHICRSQSMAERQLQAMMQNQDSLNKVSSTELQCLFCGGKHTKRKDACPAWGKICVKCRRRNHFAKCCKNYQVREITYPTESSSSQTINNMQNKISRMKSILATMVVNNKEVKFQLDTGANVNLIPKKFVPQNLIEMTDSTLTMWNGSRFKPAGKAKLEVKNPKSNETYCLDFLVIEEDFIPILGVEAVIQMKLLTIDFDNFVHMSSSSANSLLDKYSSVFNNELGKLPGKVKLSLKPDARPCVLPTRKIPLAVRNRFKEEIDRLLEEGIIAKVDEPTDWVSQIAIAIKKNGELRICIDPKPLNEALRREHFQLPVFDDLISELNGAKYFTKVDLASAFWHLELDDDSSLLTTFSTPHGRYRWLRLPFGLKVSSEIFQKRLKQAIDDLPGVRCLADDILIFGSTLQEHDSNLEGLLQRCVRDNIKLKKEKFEYCKEKVKFHGHLLTADGIKPDPDKIRAIKEMPPPMDSKGAARLCGMVTYLSRFLPKLADIIEPIRKLTHKNAEWVWSDEQIKAFEMVKDSLVKAPVLAYYNPKLPICIQCDSSQFGLGAALLQNGRPLDYRSRTLTPTEQRYAQIEKEMLAVVFALEKFNDYTFGQKTWIYTDHQPLVSIVKKPLHVVPRRLQRMMIRLQKYDYEVHYIPGKEMLLADTLSRAPLNDESEDVEFENVNAVHEVITNPTLLQQFRQATDNDANLQALKQLILEGWPNDKTTIPEVIRPYFTMRSELTCEDDLLFRGDRIIVPKNMRSELMKRIHTNHMGINACLNRARECFYWPGMTSQLKDFIASCKTCREHDIRQTREPIERRDPPERPWQFVATDIFNFGGKQFLVTVDYYTDFFEIDELTNTTTRDVTDKLRGHFARYGIPETLISDGGPQFTSLEFKNFIKCWELEHHVTTPYHSQSNGKAESAVKEAKKILRKATSSNIDPGLVLLEYRNTPTELGLSAAQRMFNRRMKTLVPVTSQLLRPEIIDPEQMAQKLRQRRERYQDQYDKHSRKLSDLQEGDVVWVEPVSPGQLVWKKAKVIRKYGRNSYIIELDGKQYRRSRVHLRKARDESGGGDANEITNSTQTLQTKGDVTV